MKIRLKSETTLLILILSWCIKLFEILKGDG